MNIVNSELQKLVSQLGTLEWYCGKGLGPLLANFLRNLVLKFTLL